MAIQNATNYRLSDTRAACVDVLQALQAVVQNTTPPAGSPGAVLLDAKIAYAIAGLSIVRDA